MIRWPERCGGSQIVQLWTWQGCGYDICDAKVRYDRNKARYYADPDLPCAREAYERLFRELGTDQFVWCCTQEPLRPDKGAKWALRVPAVCVLRFIDSLAWNQALGLQPVFPQGLRNKALELTRHDPTKYEAVTEQLEAKINARYEDRDPWQILFGPPTATPPPWDHSVSALVLLPVDPAWVLEGPFRG